jgi:rsbT co-antagonist protein RsbR
MEASTSSGTDLARIQGVVARLEANLASVRLGALDVHVEREFPDEHPLGALASAIAETVVALRGSKAEREQQELELELRIRTIRDQQAAILELSSPVIEVWRGVLTLPIVGTLDAARAATMTSNLLEAVSRKDARLAIIDVTGMHNVGADVCDHILRMGRCVALIGARCALSGMRPEVATTIVELGADLGQLQSFPTLSAALTGYVRSTPAARAIARSKASAK